MPLPDNHYICDYYSLWQSQNKLDTACKFLFKRKVLIVDPNSDFRLAIGNQVSFNFVFHEILYDFKNGRITPPLDDIPSLIALQLQIKNGNDDPSPLTK
jgi:hypothetical protein